MTEKNEFKRFQCQIHGNVLTEELLQQHPQWFPAAYLEAEPMAELVIALAERSGSRLVMLPFDLSLIHIFNSDGQPRRWRWS